MSIALSEGLISSYSFDTDASDSTGTNHGANSSPAPSYISSVGRDVVSFDGIMQNITFPGTSDFSFTTGDFALSLWINPGDNTQTQTIGRVVIGNHQTISGTHWAGWSIRHSPSYPSPAVNNRYTFHTFAWPDHYNTTFTLLPNQWQHLAINRSGTVIEVYVNGVLASTGTCASNFAYNQFSGDDLKIGIGPPNGSAWKGMIDDLKVWNRTLSASNLAELNPTPSQLLSHQYLLHADVQDSFAVGIANLDGTNQTDIQFVWDADIESMVANFQGTSSGTAYFQISNTLANSFGTGTDGTQADTGAYSLGFWIRPTSLPSPSGQHYIITDHSHGVGGESFQCWLDDQGDIYLQHKDQNGGHTTWSWDTNTPLNQWSHILFTWDDQNGTCYLNGNTLGSKVMTAPPWDSPNPLFVGYRNQGGGDNHYGFEGYMTNLDIWLDQVLSPSQVSAVYSSVQKQTNTGENNMSFSTANKVRYLFEESLASSDSGSTGAVTLTGAENYIDVVDDRQLGAKALTSPDGGWATLPSDMSQLNSTEGYTISFWAKADQYQSGQSTPYAMEGMFLSSGGASSPYNFSFHNSAGTFLDWGMGASNGEGRLQSWTAEITNAWKHFAIVVKKGDAAYGQANQSGDDALMRIYVNGGLVASQSPKSGSTYLAFDPQTADLSGWNIGRGFQGDIDAFEVYDAPATSADVLSLYSAVLEVRTDVQITNVQAGSSAGSVQFDVGSTQHPVATLPFAVAVIKDDGQLLYNGMDPLAFMSMGSSGPAFDPLGTANSYPPVTATQYLYSNNKWGGSNGADIDLENDSYSLYWTDDQNFINAGMSMSTLDPSFTAADGTLLGSITWDGSSFSFSASGASPYAGLVAGDYPLEDIMDALHLDNDGSYLDKVSLTQIKSRLASGDQYGYRPRHVETSLLAEEFIKDLKSMTILAAKNANHISVAEYDLMVLASPAGFGYDHGTHPGASIAPGTNGYDSSKDPAVAKVPEVPMVMMLDSYRSQLSRLLDRDETIRWDSAPHTAIMVAKSSQNITAGHTGGLLVSAGDLKVTSKLVVAAALQIGGDLDIASISWDDALAGGLVTQVQYDAEVPANGDGTHPHADLIHLKVDSDFTGAGDLEVLETTTFGDAQANKSPSDLAADLVDMNSTLEVVTTSELHKDVHAHSTMQVQDTAGAYAASNAYATNITGDVQIGLTAAPTNALHLDVNAATGDNLLDSKATFDEDLQVEGLLNVDGAAAFDGATFTTFDVLASDRVTFDSADADSGSTPSISIKAEATGGTGGTVKFETTDSSKKIHLSSAGVGAKTLITGAVDITDELDVGGAAQLGDVGAAKSDSDLAADLVDINANLTVAGLTQMDEKVDADSTLSAAGKVTIKDSSSTGSVLDGDLTVGADAAAAKSDMGAAVTAGADAIAGLSQTKVMSDIKVGDLGSEVAITINDAPGSSSTYHDSRTIEDGVSLNASGLAVIRSNDVSNPDADDIDVHIWASDAAGSIYLKGHQGIEVIGDLNAGSGADIKFDDQVDIKGNLTIEVDQNSAGPAMKMVSGGTNKMTMTVNTSGAAPKVDTVINNTVTAGIPQGGQLSIDGSLTVTGALLTPSPQLNIQAQTEVKISDNIFELSYESEFLSFADAIAFQSTHNAFSIAQIEAAAVAASDSDATLYAELTDAEKAQSTGGTAVEVRRDSNAGLYVPRTAVNPDGLSFWLQSSGDSHASDSDFMDRVINQGSRAMVVSPNNANPTDINDDTVMSIVRDGAGYLDGQAGSTYLDGSLVQALPVTPLWWQALLRASRLSSSEYTKMQATWNDAQLMLDPNWVAMSEAEIRANVLFLAGQTSTTPARDETPTMGLQYTGPMFHALQEKFAVLDNTVFQLMFAEKDIDGSGKLSIQNSGAKSGSRHIFGTAPSLVVGGNGGVDKSEFGSTLDMGTDSSKADLMVFKAHAGAPVAQNIQLDSQDALVFTQPAGQLRPGHASGQGMLLGAQHSMDAESSDLLVNGQAQVNLKLQVKSLDGDAIGLGAAANAVTSWGPFVADEASVVKVDLMAGSQGSGLTRGFVFNDDAPVIPALRLASSIDAASSREIFSGAEAEFQLNNFASGNGGEADALIGGSLAMAGTTRDRLVAESSIWFGEELHVDMLKSSQDELRLQDKFTDGSTQLIDGSAGSSYKDIAQANVDIYGYTFSPDDATIRALIRAGVDVLHELTMQEAHDAGLLPANGAGSLADHLATAGALASDPSGKSFVNLMKSISAAMNASAGMSHEERISQYYAPNTPIAMSEAFHALPIGTGAEGDIATGALADATKKRIEVYLNGQRIPDSEYDLILSATHSGKKIAFRKSIERRDILIIESKVANPG